MLKMDIEIKGLDEVADRMTVRGKNIKDALNRAIKKSVFILEKNLKIESPVRTGRLRNSIHAGIVIGDLQGSIGPTVLYAKFVNYGTRFITPNPFIQRGANASLKEINQAFGDEIHKALNV